MSAKELAENGLRGLPDDATVEDVHYSLYVADLLEKRGVAVDQATALGVDEAVRQGKLISHEDVVKRINQCLQK
jgi:hypothetical protein